MHATAPGATASSSGGGGGAAGGQDWSRVLSFLDRLSPMMMGRLYESPSSCLCIFRLLPETARHTVLDMLWYDRPVTYKDLALWIRQRRSDGGRDGERRHLDMTLSALARLHILTEQSSRSDTTPRTNAERGVRLGGRFRASLKMALTGGGSRGSFGDPSDAEDVKVTSSFLDQYAETQWEMIQHFMVGSSIPGIQRPSDGVLGLLKKRGLMTSPPNSPRTLSITSSGFQFLLEDINAQLWDLLLQYLYDSPDVVEVLRFLFMLASLELGRGYSAQNLSTMEKRVLQDLCDYGLVYRLGGGSNAYYPTRLATTLTSSAPPLVSSRHADEERGFVVLETNYKIYAYTSNPLQIAVLNLFVHLKNRFPNFVTGHITRDSIRRGLSNGITAIQIISYLSSRAHPQMRADAIKEGAASILPTTVVDQIRLWEQEGQRVQTSEGYLYDDFLASSDYELVASYARDLGAMLWELPSARKMFVTLDGHAQLRYTPHCPTSKRCT
ncbi:BQ2448_5190 [Microbotryum intermedium]|uniref:RNA polymerase II transcription factor B subunit 2 n=1 Tax=Microbotryum intermedium TaxID=269621 RepID=A0A238F4F9_9BASI|nr:BQ2448_5190 [Microbotryum intermedium]